ncbi:coiled-coil domain-containing protein [Marinoscillum pacificum]|uniref:coiled-coil domain-containing protein n=1 Tax=Marinoscillum pacificum TaxID=392723 RepID=UPI002158408A|nr:hypothetical protein [Marinoscillum pacificum]
MTNSIKYFSSIGHKLGDSEEIKVQKSFLVFLATFMSMGGIIWGTLLVSYDIIYPSFIPYGYVLISIINILGFKLSKNFKVARVVQIFISMALPFMLQASLGGFLPSGMVMLWSILALLASLSFEKMRYAMIWLVLFVTGTVFLYLYDDVFYQFKPEPLSDVSLGFLALNAVIISSVVFALVYFFVVLSQEAQHELVSSNDMIRKLNTKLVSKTQQLEKTQKALQISNQELQNSKERLLEITKKQTEINERLLKEKGRISA